MSIRTVPTRTGRGDKRLRIRETEADLNCILPRRQATDAIVPTVVGEHRGHKWVGAKIDLFPGFLPVPEYADQWRHLDPSRRFAIVKGNGAADGTAALKHHIHVCGQIGLNIYPREALEHFIPGGFLLKA